MDKFDKITMPSVVLLRACSGRKQHRIGLIEMMWAGFRAGQCADSRGQDKMMTARAEHGLPE